jgi:superfamily II DNA/RNA helicase
MGWFRRLVNRLGRTGSGGRRSGDQPAIGVREQDALSRWESEGGASGEVREENVGAVRKAGEEERAKQDSMTNIDGNAVGDAASSQSAKDAAAASAGNPAEQGGQG